MWWRGAFASVGLLVAQPVVGNRGGSWPGMVPFARPSPVVIETGSIGMDSCSIGTFVKSMTDAIDAVCFDLDETLCTYTQPASAVLDAAFEKSGVAKLFSVEAYYERFEDYLQASEDVADLRARCFGDLAVEAGHGRDTGEAVASAYAEIRDPGAVELLPGAEAALETLSEEYRIGLVTNGGPDLQRSKLEAVGIDDAFETAVFAGYDTRPKPHTEPFDVALDRLDATNDRAVHVGNSLASDVAGAHAAGLQSVWIPAEGYLEDATVEDHPPDHTVDSLHALLDPPWA